MGYQRGLSLLEGWLPWTVQAVVLLLFLVVIVPLVPLPAAWSRRRRPVRRPLVRLGVVAVLGLAGALAAYWAFQGSGLASDPAPFLLWVWVGLLVASVVAAVVVFGPSRWWRRVLSVVVVPLTVVCLALVLNQWVGYVTTVQEGWGEVTAGALPDQVDPTALPSMVGTPRATGAVVTVSIPDTASGFAHRTEDVWLPPAYFAAGPRPTLPAIMMIGGEFNTPADWIRIGNAVQIADQYAAAHHGMAPVLVFADAGGTFNNDTECVNGPRGNAASHLTGDVIPYVEQNYGVSKDPRAWGVVGWSMGGTCAVDLAVMHPELIDSFDDIAGDAGPEVGTKQQTIDRLYGGNAAAWAQYDPATVLTTHAPYANTAGWFDDSSDAGGGMFGGHRPPGAPGRPPGQRPPGGFGGGANGANAGIGGRGGGGGTGQELPEARALCSQAQTRAIACAVNTQPGRHSWQFASTAFSDVLPWMSARVEAPGTPAKA
ncbi:esterase family protein [Actinomycetospora endophytica]|uniref:Esterase family protein n=1 Tax=Actinomycetospora endophytica TaxID=2291215 RepID=A0ABS8PCQ7_9PSEU|nr:alpha/beta hydrolase-fold protein [Actinomycetospora endophytica]MCD2196023.1 esterase family protein [Actinomycetospora endophytica]